MICLNKKDIKLYKNYKYRVFETDSTDGCVLVISKRSENTKLLIKKIDPNDCKSYTSRLVTNDYSIPFKNPHPYLKIKINVVKEI